MTNKTVNIFPNKDVIIFITLSVPSLSYFLKKLADILANINPHTITNIDACLLVINVNNVSPANIKKSLKLNFVSVNIKNIKNTVKTINIALLFIRVKG